MDGCIKCRRITAGLFLLAGIGFLLADFGQWSFWNLQWYTLLFLIVGVTGLAMTGCKDCQAMKKK